MTTKRYGLVAVCLLLAGLVLMAALGSANSNASPSNAKSDSGQLAGATPSPAGGYGSYGDLGSSTAADSGKPGGKLAVRVDDKLGPVMTDGQGFTLYRFDKDTAKPPASNCSGTCATTWPPVINDGSTSAGTGIDPSKLGEITRTDGTRQLTVGGWPAYRYAQDAAPGDTKGEGVGGTWHALAPDGTKAKAPGAAATASTAPTAPATAMPQPSQQAEVKVQISVIVHPQLGQIMVDGYGRTLYHYGKDTAWPMRSNCEGQCLKTWTPAPPVDPTKIKGVDPKLIGKMQRPDGTWQLSINCTPAYLYTGDQGYGDALGNGMGDQWSAINPQGKPATGK
ncbi:SCO0930 family lipoprotein [Kitasatospora atroaurantiaca]|uniref:Putative lipoprotein with Yx(FWY)xxD motif n=1 Tax=Kitasatospora atroaurantiaca TaxID=285545 RepID=A0A561F146_9ACTN|nr:SCO0930 family lipoprotein [Kitasatospora atroaurantiaca]TWE21583.1 putative lipoprotein with Yx(FWY)xxD motif [Kitasatospora atroaurantiaca]